MTRPHPLAFRLHSRRTVGRRQRTAMLALASAAVALPVAAQDAEYKLEVVGIDLNTMDEIPVPDTIRKQSNEIYEIHRAKWGEYPPVDTTIGGKPTLFLIRRPKPWNSTAAASGWPAPLDPMRQGALKDKALAICADRGTAGRSLGVMFDQVRGKERLGWCDTAQYSIKLFEDRLQEWNAKLLISHEFVHQQQTRAANGKNQFTPWWIGEGQANGFGYGFMENYRGFRREDIANRRAEEPKGSEQFPFFLGLRYYDHPLNHDNFAEYYPKNHPGYPADPKDKGAHVVMAGYMTGSFWRYVLRGRPGGVRIARDFMTARQPSAAPMVMPGASDRRWLPWVDGILRKGEVSGRKIWRRGIRDVLPEMITELADFPDLVAKSRKGKLEAATYDKLLWSEGCKQVDLTTQPAASVEVLVRQFASRCFRVKLPSTGAAGTPTTVDVAQGPARTRPGLTSGQEPPSIFNIAISQKGTACSQFEVGTRGQVLTNGFAVKKPDGSGCVTTWSAYYLPLQPNVAGGLQGYQTVVLTNIPEISNPDQPVAVKVEFVRPTVSATVKASPTVNTGQPRRVRKRVKDPGGIAEPAMGTPLVTERQPPADCSPSDRAIFTCGDEQTFTVTYGDARKASRELEATSNAAMLYYLQGSFSNESVKSIGTVLNEREGDGASATARLSRVAAGRAEGGTITIHMKRLAEGQTGTFPARLEFKWFDGNGGETGEVSSLTKGETSAAGDCIVVDTLRTNAKVTISANEAGFVIGSVSGELYEDNPDGDEAVCRDPIVSVGTIEAAFASPQQFLIGPGDYEVDLSRRLEQAEIDQDLVAQIQLPHEQRSDILETFADGLVRAPVRAAPAAGAASATCSVQPTDEPLFIRTVALTYGATEPAMIAQVETMLKGLDRLVFTMEMCRWIRAGRPATFELEEE